MKTAIVTIFDEGYLEHAAVFLSSLSDNYHYHEELDVVCMVPDGTDEVFDRLSKLLDLDPRVNVYFKSIDVAKFPWIASAVSDHWGTATTWFRLFLGQLLPEYDKAIYFDVDMLVVDNIQPILDHPMHNKFMAVMDPVGVEYIYQRSRGAISYLTDGMFVADLNWWRDSNIESTFIEYIEENGIDILLEEHVLNACIKPYWHPLPFTFNFYMFKRDKFGVPDFDDSDMKLHYKHAIVFHFAGKAKPWNFKELIGKEDISALGSKWRNIKDNLGP
jgi:lipopolysaccharide biosynthesis glycosyltransferase